MFKSIVWATDGSDSADLALPYAKSLAKEHDAKLHVVHCVEHLVGPRAGGLSVHPDEDELKVKIKRQVAELAAEGIDAEEKIAGGPTLPGSAHMIADAAREADADVIIVGTRGHTPLAGLLLGSVTERLLHIAPCPVLAVPAGRRAKGEAKQTSTEATAAGS